MRDRSYPSLLQASTAFKANYIQYSPISSSLGHASRRFAQPHPHKLLKHFA